MKRLRLCLLVAAMSIMPLLHAADTAKVELRAWGEYGYSYALSNYADMAAMATWHVASNIDLGGGLRMKIPGIYAFDGSTRIKFPVRRITLFIENRYLWQRYEASNMQEVNAAMMLGLGTGRLEMKVGVFNKFYTTIHRTDRNADYIFEPLNLAYSIRFTLRPEEKRFNAALQLCNVDDFCVERFYSPATLVDALYRLTPRCSLFARVRLHSTGIFDLSKDRFDMSFIIGTKLTW